MFDYAKAVEKYRDLILSAERYLWANPETGYREVKTSAYMAEQFERLGYTLTYAEGITGFITRLETGREGPEVLILGELDSIICPAHPESDPVTGAAHSCGHHAQCATLLGIAAALKENGKRVECNSHFFWDKRASERFRHQYAEFLRELFEMGIPVTYGSDSHEGYADARPDVIRYLSAAGFADGDITTLCEEDLW
jgi:hypothetical protein